MNTKFLINMILSLGVSMAFVACSDSTQTAQTETTVQKANLEKVLIDVEGMTCEGCEMTIQNNLSKLSGVVNAKASHVDKTTEIEFDSTKITQAELEAAIIDTGYKVMSDTMKKELKTAPASTMKCGAGKCGASMKCGSAE